MRNRIWHRIGKLNLKIFFSISLGVHLIGLSTLALLFPDLKIDRILPLHIEVSLLPPIPPVLAKEKPRLKAISPAPARTQMQKAEEESLPPSPPSVEKNISVEERKVLPFENGKREIGNKKEEKPEKEPVTTAMPLVLPSDLDSRIRTDEKVLHLNEDSPKTGDLSISLGPSHSEKSKDIPTSNIGSHEGSQIAVKLNPPLSESKIFVQPRYAGNPKPVYPQEARRRGYEGDVLLKVEVLTNGRVGRVEMKKSSGYEILDRSALTAVKQWKFIPANEGNGSIPCWVNIPIKFQLR